MGTFTHATMPLQKTVRAFESTAASTSKRLAVVPAPLLFVVASTAPDSSGHVF
jgi:hypothetical protein